MNNKLLKKIVIGLLSIVIIIGVLYLCAPLFALSFIIIKIVIVVTIVVALVFIIKALLSK